MGARKLETFLKQARRGQAVWRMQYRIAFAFALMFAMGAAVALWAAWQSDDPVTGLMNVMLWLALAAASSVWAIHAEIMQGAAAHVERVEAPPT